MEKYGFVYIWYDRKHKRFYIGSHWGTVDDGYICSSTWMRNAYKYRKDDFKRKIITKVFTSKADLLKKEYEYLSLIKEEELGKRYYNLTKHLNDHWFTEEERAKTLSEKISQKTKEAMYRPDVREKYFVGLKKRNTKSSDPEVCKKRSETMIKLKRNKGKITVRDINGNVFHTTKDDPRWLTKEIWAASKGIKRPPLSKEHKEKIKETTTFKSLNIMKIKCNYCDFIGNKGNVARYHNEKCKQKIICS
jgi:hypothetical protein